MLERFWLWLDKVLAFRYRRVDYYEQYRLELEGLAKDIEYREQHAPVLYTTIPPFRSQEAQMRYWTWVKSVIHTDEWGYMMFTLRENSFAEMAGVADPSLLLKLSARLDALQIIDAYLQKGVDDHEAEIQRLGQGNAQG